MFEPGDLSPISYWAHLGIGSLGLIGAVVALLSRKGSRVHRIGGWTFITGATVAALTALHFQFTRFAPPPVLNSLEAFIGISTGLLALRRFTPAVYRTELALGLLNTVLLLAFLTVAIPAAQRGQAAPMLVGSVAVVPAVFRAPLFEVQDDFGLPPWALHIPLAVPPLLIWIFRQRLGLPTLFRTSRAA